MNLIQQLFGADVQIQLEVTPRQQGTVDCGLFAIAIAICTSLAHGQNSSSIVYQQHTM